MLTDAKVSHRHAFLTVLGGGRAVVTDLGSRNGTYVNGQRLEQPLEVRVGDRLRFGDTSVAVTSGPAGADVSFVLSLTLAPRKVCASRSGANLSSSVATKHATSSSTTLSPLCAMRL